LTVTGVGTAWAGEVAGPPTGTGQPGGPKANGDGFSSHLEGDQTPIADYGMQSVCAFSGLNMNHDGKPEGQWPPVQSYGAEVSRFAKDVGGPIPVQGIPGDACNGHTGELS